VRKKERLAIPCVHRAWQIQKEKGQKEKKRKRETTSIILAYHTQCVHKEREMETARERTGIGTGSRLPFSVHSDS